MAPPRKTIDELPEQGVYEAGNYLIVQDSGVTKKMAASLIVNQVGTPLQAHIDDATDAHDASAISATASGVGIDGPNVQAQLGQLAALIPTQNEVQVGADEPTDAAIELWYDSDEPAGVDVGSYTFATEAETIAGTVADKAVTPAGLAYERPYIDVRTHGATGDGTTDDTAGIQAAINACSAAGGGIVLLPRGTYRISATLILPSFVALVGVGGPYRASEWGINPVGVTSWIQHVASSAFTMLANSDTTNGNTSIEIRGLRLGQVGETGDNFIVDFNKVRRSLIRDCYFQGEATTSRIGFRHRGISEHNAIEATQFEGCGIVSDGSANKLMIHGCEIGAGGISITGGFDHQILDCDIYNNGVSGTFPPYPNCIRLTQATAAIIRGNQVAASLQHGIVINSSKRCVIVGNTIKDSSRQTANIWSGIALDTTSAPNPCEYNVVANNVSWDTQGAAGTQKHGIALAASVAGTNNNLIEGNVLAGNRTSALNQVSTLYNKIVSPIDPPQTTAYAASITPAPTAVNCLAITLTGPITFNNPGVNETIRGINLRLILTQDGVGGRVVTFGTAYKPAWTPVTTAGKINTIDFQYDGTNWVQTAANVGM